MESPVESPKPLTSWSFGRFNYWFTSWVTLGLLMRQAFKPNIVCVCAFDFEVRLQIQLQVSLSFSLYSFLSHLRAFGSAEL